MVLALRRAVVCLAVCLSLLLSAAEAFAVPHVRGYTRKDGTYVRPHYRSAPGTGSSRSYAPRYSPPSGTVYAPPAPVAPRAYEPPKRDYAAPPARSAPLPRKRQPQTYRPKTSWRPPSHAWKPPALSYRAPPRIATGHHSRRCVSCSRTAQGWLARSDAAKRQFKRQTGYSRGRPGYVIDHIIPLACGGPDEPSNMQWQTIAEAKTKDRIERRACS
jgi:hypothetical protein